MFWGTNKKKEVKAVIFVEKNARENSRLTKFCPSRNQVHHLTGMGATSFLRLTEMVTFFWNNLADSINYAYQVRQFSVSQRRGIIKVTPKKDADPCLVKN